MPPGWWSLSQSASPPCRACRRGCSAAVSGGFQPASQTRVSEAEHWSRLPLLRAASGLSFFFASSSALAC
eukprot:1150718-Amphidinium_carterae.2